jgi:hypothetical protein
MIHLIQVKATKQQLTEMLETLNTYVKLAVDIEKEILVGGGSLHADCEAVLLENGSSQENVWRADWFPKSQEITYESLINIRPRQNNFGLEVQDENIREQIREIVERLLKGVEYE